MGEQKVRGAAVKTSEPEVMAVDTMGGRIQVHWDQTSQATPNGQLVFFVFWRATIMF